MIGKVSYTQYFCNKGKDKIKVLATKWIEITFQAADQLLH